MVTTQRALEGRRILVTGAGRGMGRSHAITVAEEGGALALLDLPRCRDELEETAALVRTLGPEAVTVFADVSDAVAATSAVSQAVEKLGGLDGIVANAGVVTRQGLAWELGATEWERVVSVNLTGAFNTCVAAIPHLIESSPGASLVLIGSAAGTNPLPLSAPYNAAKAGVQALSVSLAQELGFFGIRCNLVLPGAIDTPMNDEALAAQGMTRQAMLDGFLPHQILAQVIEPQDVSDAVVWLLSDRARMVTGAELRVDAGWTRKHGTIPRSVYGE